MKKFIGVFLLLGCFFSYKVKAFSQRLSKPEHLSYINLPAGTESIRVDPEGSLYGGRPFSSTTNYKLVIDRSNLPKSVFNDAIYTAVVMAADSWNLFMGDFTFISQNQTNYNGVVTVKFVDLTANLPLGFITKTPEEFNCTITITKVSAAKNWKLHAHEMGHCFGLGHALPVSSLDGFYSLMIPSSGGSLTRFNIEMRELIRKNMQ
jgi:hypothetical protein